MKKIVLTATAVIAYSLSWAQYNTTWYTNPSPAASAVANTSTAGYIGIGTRSTNGTANSPLPAFNLHLHGTSDYILTVINPFPQAPSQANLGKTTRLGFTNTTTGMNESDGGVIRMSDNSMYIENREVGDLQLLAGSNSLTLSAVNNRTWFGSNYGPGAEYAKFNITGGTDNGLYIKTLSGKYGLSIRSGALADHAIQVMSTDGTTRSFDVLANGSTVINYNVAPNSDKVFVVKNASQTLLQVTNEGIVRARGIKVNADVWADYVFEKDYELRSLEEVKEYIDINGHLPEVPSTAEVSENGIDVGEMNTILLKKVEELTLYLLEQDAKIKSLENSIEQLNNK